MLEPLGEVLMRWFFELREQGFIVFVRLMTLKACELSAAFCTKGARENDIIVRRFLARNKIVLRAITHECQRPPEAVLREEALDFIRFALPKVIGINRCNEYVLVFYGNCLREKQYTNGHGSWISIDGSPLNTVDGRMDQ